MCGHSRHELDDQQGEGSNGGAYYLKGLVACVTWGFTDHLTAWTIPHKLQTRQRIGPSLCFLNL